MLYVFIPVAAGVQVMNMVFASTSDYSDAAYVLNERGWVLPDFRNSFLIKTTIISIVQSFGGFE